MNEILKMMVEIRLPDPDAFLKIKETLTRIGMAVVTESGEKKLYPSCVILHKRGKYYISHFKLLFALDGKTANISTEDVLRMKTVAHLIVQWGLAEYASESKKGDCASCFNPKLVRIVQFGDKKNWQIIHKYTVGAS